MITAPCNKSFTVEVLHCPGKIKIFLLIYHRGKVIKATVANKTSCSKTVEIYQYLSGVFIGHECGRWDKAIPSVLCAITYL
jgi:hypothetical protein